MSTELNVSRALDADGFALHFGAKVAEWDGEELIIRHDPPTGAWICMGIHSTRLGPAVGGTRMRTYPALIDGFVDAMRLSAGMTAKMAAAGLPLGGGKTVIIVPPDLHPDDRQGLLRRFGALIRQLGGLYLTGPDVGTTSADMDIINETAEPFVFGTSRAVGIDGSTGGPTSLGVFSAIEATCEQLFGSGSLDGVRVLVQGVGSVGGSLIDRLIEARAEVAFSDVSPDAIARFRDERGLPFVPPDLVSQTECDIYAPCALGGVLNEETIPLLRCKAVVGAANNQLATPEDALRLHARDILYVPDFIANSGGAIAHAGQEALGWTREEAETRVRGIKETVRQLFQIADREQITTDEAGHRLAADRLANAGSWTPGAMTVHGTPAH